MAEELRQRFNCDKKQKWVIATAALMALAAMDDASAKALIKKVRSMGDDQDVKEVIDEAIKAKEARTIAGSAVRPLKGSSPNRRG